jgi:hypothetical protein
MDTRSFPGVPLNRHQKIEDTESIPVVGIVPETNLEKAMFWLGTLSGETFSVQERINLANVYAALALQDAIRDVTVSMVKLGRTRR